MNYPILMADIENSGDLAPKTVLAEFKKLVKTFNSKHANKIKSPLTITLGDEFQGITNSIQNGLEIIFLIEEFIIKAKLNFRLRYVLYYGAIDTKINTEIAHAMLGSGLTSARKTLNLMKKENVRFSITIGTNEELNTILNKTFLLYQGLVDTWKEKDIATVSAFLNLDDYKKVAKQINTDISSAWRRKKSLRITEYATIKELLLFLAAN